MSTVLYYKVLQYADYSRNLKVAAIERRLRKEGRYAELEDAFQKETGEHWANYRNDELVVDSVVYRTSLLGCEDLRRVCRHVKDGLISA